MLICLLRHGETDWNNMGKFQGREDVPLNMSGIEQAKEAAKFLKKFSWKAIVTSPLSRAKTTAEIVSKELSSPESGAVELHEEADFIERDYGKLSGTVSAEHDKYFPDENNTGIEPYESLQKRTVTALLKYAKKYEGSNIIIVSHGAAINSIMTYFENETDIQKTPIKNASITLLEKSDAGIKTLFFNKTAGELITPATAG